MGVVSASPNLPEQGLSAFYTTDQLLSDAPILILYGPSSTTVAASGSSRIQCHVFAAAGFQSYPRLAISPSSSLYSVVQQLPHADQGDEISRALAYCLYKYFAELSDSIKEAWVERSLNKSNKPSSTVRLFSDAHAAQLTTRMRRLDNSTSVVEQLQLAFSTRSASFLDVDIVLPDGSITTDHQSQDSTTAADGATLSFGEYESLIEAFGEWAFVPTSRVRRAPSRANAARRSPVFSRAQKEMLRREMCELLDTEESYVAKVDELVHQVASDFRQKARDRVASSKSPSEATLTTIFPQSLDDILQVNTGFLQAARTVLEETENDAIADIEATNSDGSTRHNHMSNNKNDPTGAVAFAACLLNWFPRFSQCYSDYMSMHSRFAQNIRLMMSDGTSSFARRVHETGEQRLTSLLIEPIQRLPRYALYVENIAHQLPAAHPAIRNLLKAKDMMRDICAQDQGGMQTAKITDLLQSQIPSWPQSCRPSGRLVTAADLVELSPPFAFSGCEHSYFVLLVFSDSMVVLERDRTSRMTAKILSSELESSSSSAETLHNANLQFVEMVPLAHVDVLELGTGSSIQTMPSKGATQSRKSQKPGALSNTVKIFQIGGIYEGKASRLVKDIAKARVENRYPEAVRESSTWSAREYESSQACLGLFSAVVEESVLSQLPANVRIVVDRNRCKMPHLPTREANDISAFVTPEDNGFFRLEVDALGQHGTRDLVQAAELTPVLCKRLNNALQMQSDTRSQGIPYFLLEHNEAVLRLFGSTPERKSIRSIGRSQHGSRTQSPVKAVANIFSSSSRDTKPLPAPPSATSVFADIVNLRPNLHNRSKPEAAETSNIDRTPSKARIVRDSNIGPTKLSMEALEQTFDSYILALHARKGNVVGRSLSNRKFADEASVNELYNVLLDEPQNAIAHEQAAQTPVDVLFASFEKFLNNAWAEQMGPLLSGDDLAHLRSGADTLSPMDYEELLQQKIEELAPQNQRALLAMIGMLIDLMEGTPNDSDRGALMMTVTEIVVRDKNAQEMMPIFDRLVEDYDLISGWGPCSGRATPVQGSMTSTATRSTHATSFSSKASSFSKRLGRGILSRQNSKVSDTASKFGSVKSWNFSNKSPNESGSKNNLDRARSVELLSRSAGNSRPVSRDRPNFLNVFDASPGSASQGSKLDHRPGSLKVDAAMTPRTKRRSSLSDVNSVAVASASPLTWTPRGPDPMDKHNQSRPTTPKAAGTLDRSTTADTTTTSVPPFFASSNKINAQGQTTTSSPTKSVTKVTILGRSQSPALLPVPRGVLSERPSSGNTPTPPQSPERATDASSPSKLRAPSPTKFSERFHAQQDALTSARTLLKGEVGKLAQDMAALGMDSPAPTSLRPASQMQSKDQKAMNNVATRMRALEAKIPHLTGGLERSLATFKAEVSASMHESDRKIRLLESDLKDANAINEELFNSTQTELTRIFKRVKEGQGIATLKDTLKDSQDEAARLRKENQRLRRELLGLKAKIGEDS